MKTTDWKSLVKSPQAAVSALAALVAVAGTAGLLNTNLSNALQTLLTAVLGILVAVGHTAATAKVTAKQPSVGAAGTTGAVVGGNPQG